VAERYLPETVLPQWDRFLARVVEEKRWTVSRAVSGFRRWLGADPVVNV
jgi:hypothetical protein